MHNLNTLHEYICIKRFAYCNETKTLSFIFYDAAMAQAYSTLINYARLSNQLVEVELSDFRLKKLWQVERTTRCIANYNKKAMAKLERCKDL